MKRFGFGIAVLVLNILPLVLSETYTYYVTDDDSPLMEVLLTDDGSMICTVFSRQNLTEFSSRKFHNIISLKEMERIIKSCDKFAVKLDESHRHEKRGIVYPGTLWCGVGNSADSYDSLGKYRFTDACCRQHDHCKVSMGAFAFKYGLFNFSIYTRSACSCDKKLRKCLKKGGDAASSSVGKLYFNVAGMKCITTAHPKTCVKRGWIFCSAYKVDYTRTVKSFAKNPSY